MSVTTIVLLSLIAAFLMLRSKRDTPTRKKKVETQVQPKKLYSSAAIMHGDCACSAVKKMGKHRFLASEVPIIPVPDCTAKSCTCKYARYNDRRNMDTRRDPFNLESDLYATAGKPERRSLKARRDIDNEADTLADFNYDDIEWIG